MKRVMLMMQLMAAGLMNAYCQQPVSVSNTQEAQRLDICYSKTTSMIFPAGIRSVDRGSADILVQKPEGVENVLKLKAAREFFPETNLTVITGDGRFYSFTVSYAADPARLVVHPGIQAGTAPSVMPQSGQVVFSDATSNEALVNNRIKQALTARRNIRHVKDVTAGIKASLKGLYTANDMFFYKIVLTNRSNIDYNAADIRFCIEDSKKLKRVATQQTEISPITVTGTNTVLKAGGRTTYIAVLPKHAIGKDKHLLVTISEQKGGRNLVFSMSNRFLLKARHLR